MSNYYSFRDNLDDPLPDDVECVECLTLADETCDNCGVPLCEGHYSVSGLCSDCLEYTDEDNEEIL